MVADEVLVVRQRHQHEQQPIDLKLLRWLARFRLCSAELVGARFGVSARMCRERLSRLEAAGLMLAHQAHRAAPKLYAVGPRGRTLLGFEQRRPPRWDTQVVHELAIVHSAAQLEMGRPSLGCSARVTAVPSRPGAKVGRRVAVEVELAPKTTVRLKTIVLGYLTARSYDDVRFVCGSPALERRLVGWSISSAAAPPYA